jgi:hypothetical protein
VNARAFLLLALLCGGATNVWALDDDESFSNYESIVSELKASAEDYKPVHEEPDWAAVALHGGLGLTATYVNIDIPSFGVTSSGLLKGFEAHIGFNMFTRNARLEAAFRNYAHDGISSSMQADMREIETTLVFLPHLQDKLLLRMGAGISERFIEVQGRTPAGEFHKSSSAPNYSLMLGFERGISKSVAIGPDFSHHAPLDASSFSKSSWDASFRLNATF